MYTAAVLNKPTRWSQVEADFLLAMEQFDMLIAAGQTNRGDRRNGKGDFFNNLIALILENCSGLTLGSRSRLPGLVFPMHNLDVAYPSTGDVQFLLEAKALGIPKHPENPSQRNQLGRAGASDLTKRIKEAAFKTIDLKAEHGFSQPQSNMAGPGGNLTS